MKLPRKYRNTVINGDVMEVLRALPDNCLDMVYGDPDYNVGIVYADGQKYRQTWDDYIDWYAELARESLRVLKPEGNLFLLNYPRQNAYLRVRFLDAAAYAVQDYAWVYNTNVGHSKHRFTTAHRSILHATKTKNNNFHKQQVALPYQNPNDKRIKQRLADGHCGRMPYSWFYFDLVKNVSKDKTFHPCQIPLPLVEMLIKACTVEKDDVFILFGGSGSELVLTKSLKRNFLSCEVNSKYHRMIMERLGDGNGSAPRLAHRQRFIQERQAPPAAAKSAAAGRQMKLLEKKKPYRRQR